MSGKEIKSNEAAWQQVSNNFKQMSDDIVASARYIKDASQALESWQSESGDMARQMCQQARTLVDVLAQGFASFSLQSTSASDAFIAADNAAASSNTGEVKC
ncbi:hypothetical protein OZX62_07495 [Bifidobacterium sp. ESL0690]|uniref:hypothetical protein n=1 Tax=Bifidobacterium sp. ESL0690 TaxID=2983214 RepID=UPI0023FA348B|nr:hypothetical protein [Bifidobacterium sp. ESL0690]WEV46282.1 hypothetical protein OZX62_07495 [Bifidobacterium sp. ESL0690]